MNYNFRGQRLHIYLDSNQYAVANQKFKVISPRKFGFFAAKDQLWYFVGDHEKAELRIMSPQPLTIEIKNRESNKIEFAETAGKSSAHPFTCIVHQLTPATYCSFSVNGRAVKQIMSEANGDVFLSHLFCARSDVITLEHKK